MHSVMVAGSFLLLVLIPCIVAVYSASRDGSAEDDGQHPVADSTQAVLPFETEEPALAAQAAPEPAVTVLRPSRIRMIAGALTGSPKGERPSRLKRVATALVSREPERYIPMAAGDPGAKKKSIRELRAKHAAAAKSVRD